MHPNPWGDIHKGTKSKRKKSSTKSMKPKRYSMKTEAKWDFKLVAEAMLQEPKISKTQLQAAIKIIVNKEFKMYQTKARKNSLADPKNKKPNATSNGQSSRKQQKSRKRELMNNS